MTGEGEGVQVTEESFIQKGVGKTQVGGWTATRQMPRSRKKPKTREGGFDLELGRESPDLDHDATNRKGKGKGGMGGREREGKRGKDGAKPKLGRLRAWDLEGKKGGKAKGVDSVD